MWGSFPSTTSVMCLNPRSVGAGGTAWGTILGTVAVAGIVAIGLVRLAPLLTDDDEDIDGTLANVGWGVVCWGPFFLGVPLFALTISERGLGR